MIKLLKHADVYAPEHLGKKDVLIVGDKICRIADRVEGYEGLPEVEVFEQKWLAWVRAGAPRDKHGRPVVRALKHGKEYVA